jgi:hypothetical protein
LSCHKSGCRHWCLTSERSVHFLVGLCDISGGRNWRWSVRCSSFYYCWVFIATLSMCDSHEQATHCHVLRLHMLGWLQSKENSLLASAKIIKVTNVRAHITVSKATFRLSLLDTLRKLNMFLMYRINADMLEANKFITINKPNYEYK